MFEKIERLFTTDLQEYVKLHGGSYIDAIIGICEENEIEPAAAAKYLSKPIIEKIQAEGEILNMLPSTAKLPI
tara:strand:+ start:1957 stop:2175 length:219 start_codon:yes stop_codon:yes gene_type:complete